MKSLKKGLIIILCISMVLSMVGCGEKGKTSEINIATKAMTEQYVLGEILKILIEEHTDLKVNITKGVGGGTANIQAGLMAKDFDLYPEYTSTGWLFVLKKTEVPDDETLYTQMKKEYLDQYGLEWLGQYGFNNTFRLLVDAESAQKYNIKTNSDLGKASEHLVFGANYDYYEREDGFKPLSETYQLNFADTKDIDIGLKYTALANGDVNVITVYTTDAQIYVADGVVLEDDKNFFANYYCATVVRAEVLEEHPELREVLAKLDGAISDEEMTAMNYALEVEHKDEAAIARDFLMSKGLIPAAQ